MARLGAFLWPMSLAIVATLGAWVLVPVLVLGWHPVAIVSGSMAPAIPAGHVVVAEPYRGQPLGPGAVVTFHEPRRDRLVTHRIASVHDDGTFSTRGDASTAADPVVLEPGRIVAVGRLVVPGAGLAALWASEGRFELLAGAITAAVVAVAAGSLRPPGRRPRPKHLRRRPARTAARLVGATGVVAVVVVAGVLSSASFAAAHTNAGNDFGARTVAPPTALSTSYRCVLLGLVQRPTITLTWTPSAHATGGYEVWRSTSPTTGFTLRTTTGATTWEDAPVSLGTTYHYRVRASSGSWVSADVTASQSTPLVCLV